MTGRQRRPRFELTFHPDIEHDLVALDPAVLDVVPPLLEDLAYGMDHRQGPWRPQGERRPERSGEGWGSTPSVNGREGFRSACTAKSGMTGVTSSRSGPATNTPSTAGVARRLTRPSSHGEG